MALRVKPISRPAGCLFDALRSNQLASYSEPGGQVHGYSFLCGMGPTAAGLTDD